MSQSDRSLETSALDALGTRLPAPLKKDAVHLAVFSATVAMAHRSGAPVGIREGKISPMFTPHVGISDPFINAKLEPGDIVQVILFPRTISEVRHVWDHPAVDKHLPGDYSND